MAVGTVEVDEIEFWDDFCSLDGLHVTLTEPAVYSVIGISCGGDDLRYGKHIWNVFAFLLLGTSF